MRRIRKSAEHLGEQIAIESDMVETPTANIASGETISTGTTLTLSCGTAGATIYYTPVAPGVRRIF